MKLLLSSELSNSVIILILSVSNLIKYPLMNLDIKLSKLYLNIFSYLFSFNIFNILFKTYK